MNQQQIQQHLNNLCQPYQRNSNSSWPFVPTNREKPEANVRLIKWLRNFLISPKADMPASTKARMPTAADKD